MKLAGRVLLALALVALAGCPTGDKPQPAPDRSSAPVRPTAASQAELYDVDVAVPADFEEEVARAIGPDTYKQALDAIESEIAR